MSGIDSSLGYQIFSLNGVVRYSVIEWCIFLQS